MLACLVERGEPLSAFEVRREPAAAAAGATSSNGGSSRRRSRSPRDRDGAAEEGSRSSKSRRYGDEDRDRDRERERDHRASSDRRERDHRDRRDYRDGDRDRDRSHRSSGYDERGGDRDRRRSDRDRDHRDSYDSRASGSAGGDRRGNGYGGNDRRSNGRDRDDYRGGGRSDDRHGGGKTASGVEVFGAGNAARSPTPEGTIPISKRKRPRTAWDIKAPGFETFTALQAKMTGIFNLPGQARPMTGYSSMNVNAPLPEIHLGAGGADMSAMSSGAAYARQARRLYVGNITPEATENNVGTFFNEQMRQNGWAIDDDPKGVQGPDPVVSVQVNHEKSYAFVEFRSADEASKAIGFDGIVFQNQVLKIRRPKDYLGSDFSGSTHIPGVVSTNVPDTPNKIFIGGLPSYLNDQQVMELLQTFGELRSFNLVKEGSTNNSKVDSPYILVYRLWAYKF